MSEEPQGKMQQKITESLNDMFDKVIYERKQHYVQNPRELPQRGDVDAITSKWANTNAMIAGAAGLVPGPWGMLAAVPEIIAVIRNQSKMIFDLCVALGKHQHIRAELVIGVLMSSMGSGGTSLIAVQGGKLLVKRASLRVMQKVIAMLGGKVTQQLLKSMVGKWLPVVGAAAMAAWARYSTKKLGEKAVELLKHDIVDGDVLNEDDAAADDPATASAAAGGAPAKSGQEARPLWEVNVDVMKVRLLTNLMLADQEAAPSEVEYLQQLVDTVDVTDAQRASLRQEITTGRRVDVDYSAFATPEDRTGLLFAAVALAKRDGKVHLAERLYIQQAAQRLGFREADVNAAFDAATPAVTQSTVPVPVPWGAHAQVTDPQFRIPVNLTVTGQITVLGVWPEASEWVATQAARIAVDALSRSTVSIALAWSHSDALAACVQEQMDTVLRPHQMHAIKVEQVNVQLAPESMAALERASTGAAAS